MSSPITLSGFNNIDFSQVLNALMAQERIPVTQLTTQQTALSNQKTFFDTSPRSWPPWRAPSTDVTAANAFDGRSAIVSDPTAATVQVGGTTPQGQLQRPGDQPGQGAGDRHRRAATPIATARSSPTAAR